MTTPTAPVPHPIDVDDAYKERNELAMLEGHDADILVEEKPTTVSHVSKEPQAPPSPPGSDDARIKDEEQGRTSNEKRTEANIEQEEEHDPNLVFWNGPEDPENPMNWKESVKWANVAAVSAITFIT